MFKNISSTLLFIASALVLLVSSCKKNKDSPAIFITDKSIILNQSISSAQDTVFVKRDQVTANLRVTANTYTSGIKMKRLYIFSRAIDQAIPAAYKTIEMSGYTKDGNNNYYYAIPPESQDSITTSVTVSLRANDISALVDEFYFVYTDDTDYAGPTAPEGVIIGPARFLILYGKLTEYTGKRIYNYASTVQYHYPGYDVVNLTYKYNTDAAADMDIYENTDDSPLFSGKFKSQNGTTFVKADATFPYANATDTEIAHYYSLGTSFIQTPDSVHIGDIYLMKLRGTELYAAMKILYIVPENGKTGGTYDNEYIIFNLKK